MRSGAITFHTWVSFWCRSDGSYLCEEAGCDWSFRTLMCSFSTDIKGGQLACVLPRLQSPTSYNEQFSKNVRFCPSPTLESTAHTYSTMRPHSEWSPTPAFRFTDYYSTLVEGARTMVSVAKVHVKLMSSRSPPFTCVIEWAFSAGVWVRSL